MTLRGGSGSSSPFEIPPRLAAAHHGGVQRRRGKTEPDSSDIRTCAPTHHGLKSPVQRTSQPLMSFLFCFEGGEKNETMVRLENHTGLCCKSNSIPIQESALHMPLIQNMYAHWTGRLDQPVSCVALLLNERTCSHQSMVKWVPASPAPLLSSTVPVTQTTQVRFSGHGVQIQHLKLGMTFCTGTHLMHACMQLIVSEFSR